jgi:hypothetical protein
VEKFIVKKSGESGESGEIGKWRNFLSKVEKFIYKISGVGESGWAHTCTQAMHPVRTHRHIPVGLYSSVFKRAKQV